VSDLWAIKVEEAEARRRFHWLYIDEDIGDRGAESSQSLLRTEEHHCSSCMSVRSKSVFFSACLQLRMNDDEVSMIPPSPPPIST